MAHLWFGTANSRDSECISVPRDANDCEIAYLYSTSDLKIKSIILNALAIDV